MTYRLGQETQNGTDPWAVREPAYVTPDLRWADPRSWPWWVWASVIGVGIFLFFPARD